MPRRYIDDSSELYDYVIAASSRESPLKRELRNETAKLPESRMQITPEQGQFMALLAKSIGARKALEIGTFTGYSAWWVAEALPEDGRLIACDLSEEWTSMARRYWTAADIANKIDLRIGPALGTLDLLETEGHGNSFDFAFIDADKENYDRYYEICLRLLRQGGMIVVDNALWGGQVMDPEYQDVDTVAIRALNEKMRDDARVDASLLPVGDGIYIARKR